MRLSMKLLLPLAAAAVAVPGPASAKGRNAVATLLTPIPLQAAPGTRLDVRWSMTIDGHPFNATTCFVRLRSRTAAAPTEGFATPTAHVDGRYSAVVRVPQGGIGGIEIGVAGTRSVAGGPETRADMLFTIANSPFRAPPARPSTTIQRFRHRA